MAIKLESNANKSEAPIIPMIWPLNLNPMQTKVRRFVPSEYGCDVEHAEQMLELARSILGAKYRVREALKVAGISGN
jgi:hypothetical protein